MKRAKAELIIPKKAGLIDPKAGAIYPDEILSALDVVKAKIIADANQEGVVYNAYEVLLDPQKNEIEIHGGGIGGFGFFRLNSTGPYHSYAINTCLFMPGGDPVAWDNDLRQIAIWHSQVLRLRMIVEGALPETKDKFWPIPEETRLRNNIVRDIALSFNPTSHVAVYMPVFDIEKGDVEIHLAMNLGWQKIQLAKDGLYLVDIANGVPKERVPVERLIDFNKKYWAPQILQMRDIIVRHCPAFDKVLWKPRRNLAIMRKLKARASEANPA